jgi:XTP/dITP diphosphohydrolase
MANQHFIFATHNQNKVNEILSLLNSQISIKSLADLNYHQPIEEPFFTLEENALIKAKTIFEAFHAPCFSEDTGLFVEALNGEPGVFTARYAGENANVIQNNTKLLNALLPHQNRKAYFKTIFTLMLDANNVLQFEGECEGEILQAPQGEQGFGYDPIFKPNGSLKSFAQMNKPEKNTFSHRQKAFSKLLNYLNTLLK